MNARAFSEREAGPVARDTCCVVCDAETDGNDLCADDQARYDAIADREWPEVPADDRAWFDDVSERLFARVCP